ncbi:hypothetical protein, conserved [Plasmodium gonderi]|uniref:Telomere length and silencing protein 1 n=1 Tax=Plasmodium gonderi TaxID=77519 RepID=A0A1Y1JPQ4_PLAGO|nr:hypothetical protein, conserved [Plasmodium gonderi]GAW82403.1 hypothetical protein, conserved [Plasmodium gonderi]
MIKKRKVKIDGTGGKRRVPFEKDAELNAPLMEERIKENTSSEEEKKLYKLKTSQNLKLLQNIRLKKKGINAENLNYDTKITQDEENEKKLLEKHFTKNITEKEIEEAHIENFIKKNMKEYYQDTNTKNYKINNEQDSSDNGGNSDYNLSKDLYKISDHLKVKNSVNSNPEKLNCITGITEVPLPIQVKLKNIEETEKLKRKLLKRAKFLNI